MPAIPTYRPPKNDYPSPDAKERAPPPAVPYVASPESDPPSHIYWTRQKAGAWPFPEGRGRERARLLFFFGGSFRAWCALRLPAAPLPRRRRAPIGALLSVPCASWLYVEREWRQNSNEREQLEASVLPAASQVRPRGTGRPRTDVGLELCRAGAA